MKIPSVSVIIPNYNHAQYLDERIQSIMEQTYQNFEIIILDDKSTDNSREVIEKYRNHPKVSHVIYNDENSGSPFVQWEKGIRMAKGDIIWIAESDDSCDITFLEKLLYSFCESNAVITFCKSQRIDERSRRYQTFHNEITAGCWNGKDFIQKYLCLYNIIMNASSAIFDKKQALRINPQYKLYKGSGDWLFWIELSECGKVTYIEEALNYFRKHSSNTTEKCYSNGTDFIEDKKIFDYLVSNKLIHNKIASNIRRNNLYRFLKFPFDNEEIRKKVLDSWGYSFFEKTHCKLINYFLY